MPPTNNPLIAQALATLKLMEQRGSGFARMRDAMLHGIYGPIHLGDTLGSVGEGLDKVDVILTNPPFGTKKGGGMPSRKFT